jgi:hypothetical protein
VEQILNTRDWNLMENHEESVTSYLSVSRTLYFLFSRIPDAEKSPKTQ